MGMAYPLGVEPPKENKQLPNVTDADLEFKKSGTKPELIQRLEQVATKCKAAMTQYRQEIDEKDVQIEKLKGELANLQSIKKQFEEIYSNYTSKCIQADASLNMCSTLLTQYIEEDLQYQDDVWVNTLVQQIINDDQKVILETKYKNPNEVANKERAVDFKL